VSSVGAGQELLTIGLDFAESLRILPLYALRIGFISSY
jgi:hypothetical protein